MPEYPDVVVYVEHLRRRLVGQTLEKIRIASPFVLRSADPPLRDADAKSFRAALARENHTLKRALTDPRLFSGVGNAYSDELLHRAKLSPVKLTFQLSEEEQIRLYHAARETLLEWAERLRTEAGDEFPEHVTAFRKEMAVHGKFRLPCPVCRAPWKSWKSGSTGRPQPQSKRGAPRLVVLDPDPAAVGLRGQPAKDQT